MGCYLLRSVVNNWLNWLIVGDGASLALAIVAQHKPIHAFGAVSAHRLEALAIIDDTITVPLVEVAIQPAIHTSKTLPILQRETVLAFGALAKSIIVIKTRVGSVEVELNTSGEDLIDVFVANGRARVVVGLIVD